MHPLKSDKPLIVYMDYKSPYAYLAKDPTYALEDRYRIEIDWRPLTLNIGSYLGTAKVDDKGKVVEAKRTNRQWAAVKYAYHDAKRYARLRNLTLLGPRQIWDSFARLHRDVVGEATRPRGPSKLYGPRLRTILAPRV